MDFTFHLNALRQTRKNHLELLEGLTDEQLDQIPSGFNNNLAWNLGHVVVTQQLLCYKLSGLELEIDSKWVDQFRKGSKPEAAYSPALLMALKASALNLVDVFGQDLKAGKFKTYQSYTTSYGVTLTSIEEALPFNSIHEGLHYGYGLALRKVLR